jgi:hypothetical protein
MNNEKYMLIKKIDWRVPSSLKVPLKAVNGEFKIKSGRKVILTIHPSAERDFVYWIYGERNEGRIAFWLRECWNKNITPMKIDEIIDSFKKSHPAEKIEDFPLEDIPLYADEDGLQLPIPNACCVISKEDEQELKKIIVQYGENSLQRVNVWFRDFRRKYGLDFQKQVGKGTDQDYELSLAFANQHGLSEKYYLPIILKKKRIAN